MNRKIFLFTPNFSGGVLWIETLKGSSSSMVSLRIHLFKTFTSLSRLLRSRNSPQSIPLTETVGAQYVLGIPEPMSSRWAGNCPELTGGVFIRVLKKEIAASGRHLETRLPWLLAVRGGLEQVLCWPFWIAVTTWWRISRSITRSGVFEASDKLALVDGNVAEATTAAKIAEVATTRFGSIDALVNNAGIYFSKRFTD